MRIAIQRPSRLPWIAPFLSLETPFNQPQTKVLGPIAYWASCEGPKGGAQDQPFRAADTMLAVHDAVILRWNNGVREKWKQSLSEARKGGRRLLFMSGTRGMR